MNVWKKVLNLLGWKVNITAAHYDKCVICVAPHTSNWDFILGLCAYKSLGREANFLMKEFWFFFPLKYLLKALGGIPVPSKRGADLTSAIISDFKTCSYMNLAVTPEGTRSLTSKWRKGFLYIAYGANVPLLLGVIDYNNKSININEEYRLSGNVDEDLEGIKKYYSTFRSAAKYVDKFTM